MPFSIITGDITKQHSDAIVNAANTSLLGGGGAGEERLLESCYLSCLMLAERNGCRTLDFPSISTGVYHFPLDRAAKIAVETICGYLKEHSGLERVRMVCFDPRTEQAYAAALQEYQGMQ